MNVAIFIGSPRINGNTATMANRLTEHLSGKGVTCRTYYLYHHKIQPCIDCRRCKAEDQECIQNDGMNVLYKNLEWADVIIFGTPIYWFGPSAQTKLMIDRFRPYFANKKLYGKRAALILPAGSGEGDCDMTIEQFKRVFKALGMGLIDVITLQAYDEGDAELLLKKHDFVLDLAVKIMQKEEV
ncbi:flavodoxin family protein [Carboxylicivirga sp. RSCT41]|uniref:flavodoxin family protein n=1 Tax=Carboxylicivirga agarovorans TaxID=3417570 RepID=UPI003D3414BE